MNENLVAELVKDYNRGQSLLNLSKKYQIPKITIYYNLNKKGIIRKQNRIDSLKCSNKKLIGTFVGLWIGDGSKFMERGRYVIKIHFDRRNTNFIAFLKKLIYTLFGLEVRLYLDGGNKASVRIFSKFVYYFLDKYTAHEKNKTLTISLCDDIEVYSKNFLEGVLLGLALSDGSVKGGNFTYATISNNLTKNVVKLLNVFKYQKARIYTHKRAKYGWHDLNLISIPKSETVVFLKQMNRILNALGFSYSFVELK